MKDINTLAAAIHQNAVDHGWWEKDRDFAEIIALIHSELSEALEEFRSGKPTLYYSCQALGEPCNTGDCKEWRGNACGWSARTDKPEGIAVELADVVIRILDYCGRRKIDIGEALALRKAGFIAHPLPELVAECHYLLSMAFKHEEPRSLYFAEIIALANNWCAEAGRDLEEVIRIKHEYNKTRPYRHGGKVC
jgi:NTP pyrophosphatase (non-canonical NTP hydrolase)